MRPVLTLLLIALVATPALSQEARTDTPPLALTYETFEASVNHIDLPSCPTELAAPDRFCRLTAHQNNLNVFAFSEDGDQLLVAMKVYPTDLLAGLKD